MSSDPESVFSIPHLRTGVKVMTELQCQVCCGALIMDISWEYAVCERCGMKYTKESIQKMLLEHRTENGAPPIADTYLLKAGRLLAVGDFSGAKKLYQTILDTVDPLSPEAWWGLLRCRFQFADMLLSGRLGTSDITFLFDGKPEWDMSAFDDNLKNALFHASPDQKVAFKHEYAVFMEALPEKRRISDENKGSEEIGRDIATLNTELDRLYRKQSDRHQMLKDIKRKKRFRMLWLILAVLGTLAALYFAYCIITGVRSFNALLFELIVSIFVMVVFWMIFSFYRTDALKKSRVAYLINDASSLRRRITEIESSLNDLKERRNKLQ